MNKKQNIEILNQKIDRLIIIGEDKTEEFKRLCALHKRLVLNK